MTRRENISPEKRSSPILGIFRSTLTTFIDFYDLLSLSRNDYNISQQDIKRAYHHKLLQLHPDKLKSYPNSTTPPSTPTTNIALLKEAFTTLVDPEKRRIYDASLERSTGTGPRPAQVVSLEDFTIVDDTSASAVYGYVCRCGGTYYISVVDMEADVHLINCESCSESIWVGYKVVEEDALMG